MGSGGNRNEIVSLESKDENDESVEINFDDAREIPESVNPIQNSSVLWPFPPQTFGPNSTKNNFSPKN